MGLCFPHVSHLPEGSGHQGLMEQISSILAAISSSQNWNAPCIQSPYAAHNWVTSLCTLSSAFRSPRICGRVLVPLLEWLARGCMPSCVSGECEVSGLESNLPLCWVLGVRPEVLAKLTLKAKLSPQVFFEGTWLLSLDDHFPIDLSRSLPLPLATLSDKRVTGITIDVAAVDVADPEVGRPGNSSVPRNTLSPICTVASRPMDSHCFRPAFGLVQNVSKTGEETSAVPDYPMWTPREWPEFSPETLACMGPITILLRR